MSKVNFNDIDWEGEISSVYPGYDKMLPNDSKVYYKIVNDNYQVVIFWNGVIEISMDNIDFKKISIPETYEASNQAMLKLVDIGDKKIDFHQCLPMSIADLLGFENKQPRSYIAEFHDKKENIINFLRDYVIDDIYFKGKTLHVLVEDDTEYDVAIQFDNGINIIIYDYLEDEDFYYEQQAY